MCLVKHLHSICRCMRVSAVPAEQPVHRVLRQTSARLSHPSTAPTCPVFQEQTSTCTLGSQTVLFGCHLLHPPADARSSEPLRTHEEAFVSSGFYARQARTVQILRTATCNSLRVLPRTSPGCQPKRSKWQAGINKQNYLWKGNPRLKASLADNICSADCTEGARR